MAKKVNPEVVRRTISSDLIQLSQVLERKASGVILNPEVLKSSANAVTRNTSGYVWRYEIAGLQLRVQVPRNSLPTSCAGTLTIEADLTLAGDCSEELPDQVTHLILQILIRSDAGEHVCAWHFDRHIEEGNPPLEAHPLFHFQHGGHAMHPHAESLGKSLLLPAPRLAFPPMDAVMTIDFILSNFAGECWKVLREEPLYVRLLRESQELFLRPYVERIASWWTLGPKPDEKIRALMPHLI
ncbi:hypothetical protein [Solimonas fluminis]|uniref:hypothetical protein n=1 Tax=Solimonas fluminis TaxID=2086571 RepID=UPI00105746BE|nr:hypothetical protein [Solimonas fluminis]